MTETSRRQVQRLTAATAIRRGREPLSLKGATALDFWIWSGSDVLGNTLRGVFAEYLVALDLGVADGVRCEWDRCDLRFGKASVEVKSAAYRQTWKQKRDSRIVFGIQPTVGWDPQTGEYDADRTPKRQADVYVFALLGEPGRADVDPLDVDQWAFSVVSTAKLNAQMGAQKTLSEAALRKLGPDVARFGQIADAIRRTLGGPDGAKR